MTRPRRPRRTSAPCRLTRWPACRRWSAPPRICRCNQARSPGGSSNTSVTAHRRGKAAFSCRDRPGHRQHRRNPHGTGPRPFPGRSVGHRGAEHEMAREKPTISTPTFPKASRPCGRFARPPGFGSDFSRCCDKIGSARTLFPPDLLGQHLNGIANSLLVNLTGREPRCFSNDGVE